MEDNSMLEIYPAEEHTDKYSNKHSGIRHLAFGTDDIERDYENLKCNNVEIIDDLKIGSNGVKTIFFRDPEGNIIHFIQRVKELC
jgi:catechol 2,3-dioxygenase-like lactoylglutathione lyase family enzyme